MKSTPKLPADLERFLNDVRSAEDSVRRKFELPVGAQDHIARFNLFEALVLWLQADEEIIAELIERKARHRPGRQKGQKKGAQTKRRRRTTLVQRVWKRMTRQKGTTLTAAIIAELASTYHDWNLWSDKERTRAIDRVRKQVRRAKESAS